MYTVTGHHPPQRLRWKHHPAAIQAMSQHLPNPTFVVSQASLGGKLDDDIDTRHDDQDHPSQTDSRIFYPIHGSTKPSPSA